MWLLELLGHRDARILDCGRESWKRAGRAWTDKASTPTSSRRRPGDVPAGLEVVAACQADCQDRQLPGRPHLLLRRRPDAGRHRHRGEMEYGPGDFFHMPPGHDAWIVGDKRCVMLDFAGVAKYAKKA